MSIFGKFFGKKDDSAAVPEGMPEVSNSQMAELLKSQEMRSFMAEVQNRLSKEDQKQLMNLALTRDPQKINDFLKSRIPDWEEMLKKAGLGS